MRFFFDNCINRKYFEALKILARIQEYELDNWSQKTLWKQFADLVSWWPDIVLKHGERRWEAAMKFRSKQSISARFIR